MYNEKEYSYLYENILNSEDIIKYYGDEDKIYLNNIVDNMIPNREEFINIYKQMLISKNIDIKLTDLRKVFRLIPLKVFVILNVFKELNLLDYKIDNQSNTISINLLEKPDKKLNLDESIILNNLKDLKEGYLKSY